MITGRSKAPAAKLDD